MRAPHGCSAVFTRCILFFDIRCRAIRLAGFPRRLENLENENGHGKVREHEKLAKSHGIL